MVEDTNDKYEIRLSKQSLKDQKKLKSSGLSQKARLLVEVLKLDPFSKAPPYEELVGDYCGFYSRRINIQHRLVYKVDKDKKVVYIIRMWTHYENL